MKYRVIVADSEWELMKSVQEFLDEGWKLQGGVSVSPTGHAEIRNDTIIFEDHLFCQAVVAYED